MEDIDWSKTKAYAIGFGGIYLNRLGREKYGIVSNDKAEEIKEDMVKGLSRFKDTKTGEMVVKNVYNQDEIFNGVYKDEGPDTFVGFNEGYRASWQTALGGVPRLLIEDNKKKWSGDHLIDPSLVDDVLFINKRIELNEPSIIDIAPIILDLFGITKPKEMQGKVLFKDK